MVIERVDLNIPRQIFVGTRCSFTKGNEDPGFNSILWISRIPEHTRTWRT